MNVSDLIALLEDMPEDAEVRFASQPSWPFEYSISKHADPVLVDLDNLPDSDDLPEGAQAEDIAAFYADNGGSPDGGRMVVYLAEGQQLGYLPGAVSSALGWR